MCFSADLELQADLIAMLHNIKAKVRGELKMTAEAMAMLDKIYKTWAGIDDIRFEHYTNRRLTHLIKLSLVIAASRIATSITLEDIVSANTLLSFTEQLMPKALGEFGKAKHSDVTHKVMSALDATTMPLDVQGIWKLVHTDLDNRNQLVEIINNLQVAEKIQLVKIEGRPASGYLPIKKVRDEGVDGSVDWHKYLTESEINLL